MIDNKHKLNEFRQDLASGEWVLFATGRTYSMRTFQDHYQSVADCPFEDLAVSGNELIWYYPDAESRQIAVIKNKFPAVQSGQCGPTYQIGPFDAHTGNGEHDIVLFKDHDLHFNDFTTEQLTEATRVYKKRYLEMAQMSECIAYVMIFHNFGYEAGASIYHPHTQMISMPILPPHIFRSLAGAERFYKKNNKKVYDVMLDWEMEQKKRIVFENDHFVALCPFASHEPYEVRIFPKDSSARFENMSVEQEIAFADALRQVLRKIKNGLNNPPFNFFIHTSPVATTLNVDDFYTWHLEITPKSKIVSGFELGTGIDINVVDPDDAAKLLRETNVK